MIRKLASIAVALTAVGVAVAGPAAAASAPAGKLTLSVVADAGWATAVELRCGPTGGPHPTAAKACAQLSAAGGKPARLKAAETMCTMQYAPVTAAATGKWHGRTVRWSHTFGNRCELTRATGDVFTF